MASAAKDYVIDSLIVELERGNERAKCLATLGNEWQMPVRTFDRYWKIANIRHQERQQKASAAADEVYITGKKEAAKRAVMTKQERLEVLTDIIRGGKDGEEKPAYYEIIKAIAEMNKMEGDYAPTKVAQTDTEGRNIRTAIPETKLDELLYVINNIGKN